MSDSDQVIDGEVLGELRDMLEDGFGEYLEQFYEDLEEYRGDLPVALKSKDADKTYQIVHSLASSCGYVGATRVVDTARRLQLIARTGDLTDAPQLYSELANELNEMKAALSELCA